jgi:nicotinamidase-related amidase
MQLARACAWARARPAPALAVRALSHAARGSSRRVYPVVDASSAFLVCDVQERFRPLIRGAESLIRTGTLLVRVAEKLGAKVVATEQNPKALGATVPELAQALAACAAPVFAKQAFSMQSKAVADAMGPGAVVLFGIEAHVCVLQTALDLVGAGREVVIVADATSSQRWGDRAHGLRLARDAGAWLTTTESLLFHAMRTAELPHFRAVSALVKAHNAAGVNALLEHDGGERASGAQ